MAAKKAIVEVLHGDVRLWAAETEPPRASTLSSLRMQPVLAVISAGQTTRLKFALCDISPYVDVTGIGMLRVPWVRRIFKPIKPKLASSSQVLG